MKETPLSFAEAKAVCNEYQHIVGMPFCGEYRGLGNVEAVVVSPWGKLNKWIFMKYLQRTGDPVQAISFYTDDEYAVVLIGHDRLNQLTCRDLSAHLAFTSSSPDLFIELD